MKKYLSLFTILVLSFLPRIASSAVNFENPGCDKDGNCYLIDLKNNNTFAGLLVYLINLVFAIVAVISIAFIIYGGFEYITSRGDAEQAESGKRTLTNAIIGLVIVTLSYTIVVVIQNALRNKP